MRDSKGRFIKGITPWNKGIKGTHFSPETEFRKGQNVNEKHPYWKGNNVGYMGIHKWIGRHFETINICEDCGIKNAKRYEWANISGNYERDRSDWKRLCKSCHNIFDRTGYKSWITRRQIL